MGRGQLQKTSAARLGQATGNVEPVSQIEVSCGGAEPCVTLWQECYGLRGPQPLAMCFVISVDTTWTGLQSQQPLTLEDASGFSSGREAQRSWQPRKTRGTWKCRPGAVRGGPSRGPGISENQDVTNPTV